MPDMRIVPKMSVAEAQTLCMEIRDQLEILDRNEALAREYIRRFHRHSAWIILGYESFASCAKAEFGRSFQQAYRLLGASQVDANLSSLSPAGESFVVPVNHARQLTKLEDAQSQYEAYTEAKKLAETEGSEITENHVAIVVKKKLAEQFTSTYAVIAHMVRTGDLAVKDGVALTKAVDRLKPANRGYVVQLIAKFGLVDADLANGLGQLNEKRLQQKEMDDVLTEIEATGHLGGVALKSASTRDLSKALYQAGNEHQSELEEIAKRKAIAEGKKVIEPVIVTLYKGDPQKTFNYLLKVLGRDELAQLVAVMRQNGIE